MRQAIVTSFKYDRNGNGRITAKSWGGRVTVSTDQGKSREWNHWRAAETLIKKMGWHGENFSDNWIAGGSPGSEGNCYVYDDGDETTRYSVKPE